MAPASPHELSERELHEYVAEVEGHDSQVTGVVGYFYAMYRAEVLARVSGVRRTRHARGRLRRRHDVRRHGHAPVQMDVSIDATLRARRQSAAMLICADGYELPFADGSFEVVLLIAMLEHTREPWRVLAEARRVLKPGGRAIMVVPNDVDDERGPAAARQISDPLSGSSDVHDAGDACAAGSRDGFRVAEEFTLPFRPLPFAVNLYYFMVAEKRVRAGRAVADPVVILGAGPAGISAAWRLSELGHPVTVLERDGAVGGMGKTIKVGDYSRRLRPAHVPHPRDRREPGDPRRRSRRSSARTR